MKIGSVGDVGRVGRERCFNGPARLMPVRNMKTALLVLVAVLAGCATATERVPESTVLGGLSQYATAEWQFIPNPEFKRALDLPSVARVAAVLTNDTEGYVVAICNPISKTRVLAFLSPAIGAAVPMGATDTTLNGVRYTLNHGRPAGFGLSPPGSDDALVQIQDGQPMTLTFANGSSLDFPADTTGAIADAMDRCTPPWKRQ